MSREENQTAVLLFDGHCIFCSKLIQFVLKHDREGRIKIASIQSPEGKAILAMHRGKQIPDSIVFQKADRIWFQSEATIQIAIELGGWWKAGILFRMIPAFIRDAAYRLIARNRYRIWGRKETCFLPDPSWKNRFLGTHEDE